jgi:outer membrane protein OmpA-like peptidoglycan-associated protein
MKSILFLFFIFYSFFVFTQKDTSVNSEIKSILEYEVTPQNKLNTRRSEFAPVKYGKGIVFVGEQKEDLIHLESTDADGHPYLDLYYSEKNEQGKFTNKKNYTKGLNTTFHDGPVTFSADLNEAYLTRTGYVVKQNDYVNQSKLYVLHRKGTHWGKAEVFKYDSDEYSVGHASISKDGKLLFFSSDMPGGFGGTDIYVCERVGDTWDKPKNLGPNVNSNGMELFPHIRNDGILFYSSDKFDGLGGLDIFSAEQRKGEWLMIRNEGLGINSGSDDFGIYFSDTANGYFSSNRQGSDDIFSFYFEKKFIDFEGYVLNSKDTSDVASDIKIDLKDKNGNSVNSARTLKNGYFKFSNLKTNETFLIDIDETDGLFNNKLKYYLTDKNRTIVRESQSDENNKFVFKNLGIDSYSNLNSELIEDEKVISGKLIFNTTQSPLSKIKIVAKDEGGKVLDETITDENGKFVFNKIPPGASILIELADQDAQLPPNTEIALKNLKGKTIKIIKTGVDGKFTMNLLRKESISSSDLFVEDTPITLVFNAIVYDDQNNTIPKLKVILKDEKGNVIATQVSDSKGKITFKKLDPDKNYLMDFDVNDTRLNAYTKIVLKAENGTIIKEVYKNAKGFEYQILKGEKVGMTEIKEEDTDFTLSFKALVYDESFNLLPNLKVVLKDEKGKIVYRDSTDKNGKITFNKLFADKSYMIEFDEKDTRLGNISKIIIKSENNKTVKEIVRNKSGFQYQILSGEKALIQDLEEADAPLTFIFKALVYDETMKILPNLIVYLKDENGLLISTDTSEANGKINFNQLIANKNYQIEFDENDERLKFIKKIIFKSENNKVVKEIIRSDKGFIYRILKGEKVDLIEDVLDTDLQLNPKFSFKAIIYDEALKVLPNLMVYLKDENGNLLSTETSDSKGKIKFSQLFSDKNYQIEFNEKDERLTLIKKIIIKSEDNKIVKEIIRTEKGFNYKILKGEKMELMDIEDVQEIDLKLNFRALVYDEKLKLIPNLKLYLKDEAGKLYHTKITDKNGLVDFTDLIAGKNYVIEFDVNDQRLKFISKIIIKSENNKVIKEIVKNKNEFKCKLLKSDALYLDELKVDDAKNDLNFMAFVYDENNMALSNLTVYLKNEKLELIKKDSTSDKGAIFINSQFANQNYILEFDENDTRLKNLQKIFIKTKDGKTVKEIIRTKNGFQYELLKADKNFMTDVNEKDVAININKKQENKIDNQPKPKQENIIDNKPKPKQENKIELTKSDNSEISVDNLVDLPVDSLLKLLKTPLKIKENITYKSGNFSISESDKAYLNKLALILKKSTKINLEISGHTDAFASDETNMYYSEKRAESAANYAKQIGIAPENITTIGYGESKLLNKCKDNVYCPEKLHAENRRTEYRLVAKP